MTLLVRGPQLGASILPGPRGGFGTKELRVTVLVLEAKLTLGQALAHSIMAVQADALPRVRARAPIIKHDFVAADGQAVCFGSFVVDLRVLRCLSLIQVPSCAGLLGGLIDPGVFAVQKVELAGDFLVLNLGQAPELVPVAVVDLYIVVGLLLIVLVAEVSLHRFEFVLLRADDLRTLNDGRVGNRRKGQQHHCKSLFHIIQFQIQFNLQAT